MLVGSIRMSRGRFAKMMVPTSKQTSPSMIGSKRLRVDGGAVPVVSSIAMGCHLRALLRWELGMLDHFTATQTTLQLSTARVAAHRTLVAPAAACTSILTTWCFDLLSTLLSYRQNSE